MTPFPSTPPTSPTHDAAFGYKGAGGDGGGNGRADQQQSNPTHGPFNPAENARLALEAKSAMVEKLQARLAAAEEAVREGEEREQELEHRLQSHAGKLVMNDADKLNNEMAGAFASLRSGFGSFLTGGGKESAGGAASAGARGGKDTSGTDSSDNEGRKVSALKSSEYSIVNKRAARGQYAGKSGSKDGSGGGGGGSKPRVGFVDDKEQARLDQEADFVAQLTQVNR
jgi:hypothetical protein